MWFFTMPIATESMVLFTPADPFFWCHLNTNLLHFKYAMKLFGWQMKSRSKRPRLNTDECLKTNCTSLHAHLWYWFLVGDFRFVWKHRWDWNCCLCGFAERNTAWIFPARGLTLGGIWLRIATANVASSSRCLTKIPISAVESECSALLSDTQLKNVKLGFPLHCFSSGCQHIKHYLKGGLI